MYFRIYNFSVLDDDCVDTLSAKRCGNVINKRKCNKTFAKEGCALSCGICIPAGNALIVNLVRVLQEPIFSIKKKDLLVQKDH